MVRDWIMYHSTLCHVPGEAARLVAEQHTDVSQKAKVRDPSSIEPFTGAWFLVIHMKTGFVIGILWEFMEQIKGRVFPIFLNYRPLQHISAPPTFLTLLSELIKYL